MKEDLRNDPGEFFAFDAQFTNMFRASGSFFARQDYNKFSLRADKDFITYEECLKMRHQGKDYSWQDGTIDDSKS